MKLFQQPTVQPVFFVQSTTVISLRHVATEVTISWYITSLMPDCLITEISFVSKAQHSSLDAVIAVTQLTHACVKCTEHFFFSAGNEP